MFLVCFLRSKNKSVKVLINSTGYRELMGVVTLSTIGFLIIQHFFFDDAGFVLRYLDNFSRGYWFKYNIQDPPVYGISGFIHGLVCGILCYTHLTTPEQALWFSNYAGFVLSGVFLFYIFKTLVNTGWKVWLGWVVTISTAKMYLSVASCGLETPLHISLLLGAIYFMLKHKTRSFFLFSALFIISKLDAIPPTTVLLAGGFLWNYKTISTKKIVIDFFIGFVAPLSIGLLIIQMIFGNILPQSAFAKLYHHPHPNDSWFPFLEYFTKNIFRKFILILFGVFACIHVYDAFKNKDLKRLVRFILGGMFLSLLVLYYWYNPAERMMWYYAMPELLLNIQIIYSGYYVAHFIFKRNIFAKIWMPATLSLTIILWILVYNSFVFLNEKVKHIEEERLKIGTLLGEIGKPNEVLLAYHGHIARHFKGYVIDGSGLNSKVATDYKRDLNLMIKEHSPDYIVNHALGSVIEICNKYNYELLGIYRDVTIDNYLPWILVKKTTDNKKHTLELAGPKYPAAIINQGDLRKIVSQKGRIVFSNTDSIRTRILHIGLDRKKIGKWYLQCKFYKDGNQQQDSNIEVPEITRSNREISNFVWDATINITGCDSVVIISDERNWVITEPIYEIKE